MLFIGIQMEELTETMHARTFQDHAEFISCNLNSGGDGRRRTRTDLKHVKDRQARVRVPREGGGQTGTPSDYGGGVGDNTCPCQ